METDFKQQLRKVFDKYGIIKSKKVNNLIDTFIEFNFYNRTNNVILNNCKSESEQIFILIESKDENIIYTYMFLIRENCVNRNIKTLDEYVLLGKMPSKLLNNIGE